MLKSSQVLKSALCRYGWHGYTRCCLLFLDGCFSERKPYGAVKYVLAMFGIGASGLLDAKAAYYMAEYKLFFLLAIAASLPIAGWLGKAKEHLDGAISVLYPVWIMGVYAVAVSFM